MHVEGIRLGWKLSTFVRKSPHMGSHCRHHVLDVADRLNVILTIELICISYAGVLAITQKLHISHNTL